MHAYNYKAYLTVPYTIFSMLVAAGLTSRLSVLCLSSILIWLSILSWASTQPHSSAMTMRLAIAPLLSCMMVAAKTTGLKLKSREVLRPVLLQVFV